jgi:hypothetical protein
MEKNINFFDDQVKKAIFKAKKYFRVCFKSKTNKLFY